MNVGTIFTLTPEIKSVITDALDDLITELGKNCRLVYPPKFTPCENCWVDPMSKKSANRYKDGGPLPFANGAICPLCNGEGQKTEEQSEEFLWSCSLDPKHFFMPIKNLDVRVPYSVVQTKGYLVDMPKVLKAEHMVLDTKIEGYLHQKYKLMSQPADISNIIQRRYFVATWEKL